jgi:hypothetical protein
MSSKTLMPKILTILEELIYFELIISLAVHDET